MTKIEKHPAPEKLLRQITAETINGLGLGGPADHPTITTMEAGAGLIAKAWNLPQETSAKQHRPDPASETEHPQRQRGERSPPGRGLGELRWPHDRRTALGPV